MSSAELKFWNCFSLRKREREKDRLQALADQSISGKPGAKIAGWALEEGEEEEEAIDDKGGMYQNTQEELELREGIDIRYTVLLYYSTPQNVQGCAFDLLTHEY